MKATELMIGDWVMSAAPRESIKKVSQVVSVNTNTIVRTTNNSQGTLADDIQSIPLTPEILEKNGFRNEPLSVIWEREYGVDKVVYIEPNERRIYTSAKGLYHMHIGDITHSMPLVYMSFTYVHQLQHALRLCGIEKEITL